MTSQTFSSQPLLENHLHRRACLNTPPKITLPSHCTLILLKIFFIALTSTWLYVSYFLFYFFTVHPVPMAGTQCPLKKRTGTKHLSFFPLSSDHFPYCVALQAESSLPPLCVPGVHAYSLCLIRELQHSACKNSNGHLPVDKQLCLYCVHGVISCLDQQLVVHFTSLQPKLLGSN